MEGTRRNNGNGPLKCEWTAKLELRLKEVLIFFVSKRFRKQTDSEVSFDDFHTVANAHLFCYSCVRNSSFTQPLSFLDKTLGDRFIAPK